MSNNKKALKSGIWYTVADFLMKGVVFITTPIFTRMLTQKQYGVFNNFSSWRDILAVLVTMNLAATMISARYDFKEDLDRYVLSMIALESGVALVWCLVTNLCGAFFTDLFELNRSYINLIYVYLLFAPVVDIFQANERFFYRYKRSVFIALLVAFSTTGLSILLIFMLPDRLLGRILGTVIPVVLIGAILIARYIKKGKGIKISYWKYALPICIPYIPHLLSLTLLNAMDKTMITKMCGPGDTALYSLAYTCGLIVIIFLTSMNTAFVPWLAEQLHSENYEEICCFSRKYILAFLALAIGVMLFAPEALLILGGKNYIEAKYVIPPVAAGCVCQFLYTMFVNVEQIMKKTIGMAFASASAAFLNFILNLLFIPKFGYIAAAYTTLAGYMWLLAIHMFLVQKMRLGRVYDSKFIICVVGGVIMLTIAMNYAYTNTVCRVLMIGVYVAGVSVALYKFKDYILLFRKNRGE